MRPVHWVKNIMVMAPLFFSGGMARHEGYARELMAFAGFCFAASFIYVLNDIGDAEQDRMDPVKRNRPYAAGLLRRVHMGAAAVFAAVVAGMCCGFLGSGYSVIIGVYVLSMVLYTFFVKRFRMAGIILIATGMILRIVAGAVAIDVQVSAWVYPSAFFLTVYVVCGKRLYSDVFNGVEGPSRAEMTIFRASGIATFIIYVIYCLSGVGPQKYGTGYLWLTAPFVAVALWRYNTSIHERMPGREHLHGILRDAWITGSVICWVIVFSLLIYV